MSEPFPPPGDMPQPDPGATPTPPPPPSPPAPSPPPPPTSVSPTLPTPTLPTTSSQGGAVPSEAVQPGANPVADAQRAAAQAHQRQGQSAPGVPSTTKQARFLHPQANSALLWGLLTFLFCSFLTPIAWKKANDARNSYNSRPGAYRGKGRILLGMWLGILGTAYLVTFVVVGALVGLGVIET